MGRLRDADLDRLIKVLREHEHEHDANAQAVPDRVLGVLGRVVPGDILAYQVIDERTGRSRQVALPSETVNPQREAVFERGLPDHPLLHHIRDHPTSGAVRLSDVTTRGHLHNLAIYHEFYRPLRVEHQVLRPLPAPPHTHVIVVVNRSRTDFSDTERDLLDLAGPAFGGFLRAAEAHRWLDAATAALDDLDDTAYGVVELGADATVRTVNRAGRLLLSAYFPRRVAEGRTLPDELVSWLAEQRRVPHHDAPGPPRPYRVTRGERRLTVRLLRGSLLLSETRAEPPGPPTPATGLTARETDVLWYVAHGRTTAQVARALRISPRTVEKHLQNVYAKIGVTGRAEAALRVFGGRAFQEPWHFGSPD
ncbi:helix-turn-helix transcriptional regulator [Saccharothrix obliqua]|uniref:helix-turn-helix transcriptional regulator n=1 Tax=Saccharothrix obliqua TaxID=2861747 RepID=UPI001C5FBA07|nr:helix-turn-helix transcriptional regulator [Saccharothrix obliqua]MBW4718705.1 helix-turn-helix transcriptional regulator [Saccharothrix obliqua]